MSAFGLRECDHLTGDEAVDVSRMTGIPWHYAVTSNGGEAVPHIGLHALSYIEQCRVALCRLGAWYYLDCQDADNFRAYQDSLAQHEQSIVERFSGYDTASTGPTMVRVDFAGVTEC